MGLSTLLTSNQLDGRRTYYSLAADIAAGGPTTVRAGSATTRTNGLVVPVAANLPRIWEGSLLVEPAMTQSVRDTEDFGAANWTRERITQAISGTAPDGTATANVLTVTAGSGTHRVYGFVTSAIRVASLFVKAGTARYVTLAQNSTGANNCTVTFDFNTNTVADGGGTNYVDSGAEAWANGWYRIWCRYNGTQAGTFDVACADTIANSKPSASWVAAGTETVLVWGGNGEDAGFYPSSYLSRVSAASNRAADVCSRSTTGWPTAKGRIDWTFTPRTWGASDLNYRFMFDGLNVGNGLRVQKNNDGTSMQAAIGSGGAVSGALTWTNNQTYTFSLRWNGTGTATLLRDGVVVASGAGGAFASWLANCYLGSNSSSFFVGGTLGSFKVQSL